MNKITSDYLILGSGPAALSAVRAIKEVDETAKITLAWSEAGEPYCRLALPYFVSGRINKDGLILKKINSLKNKGIKPLPGHRAKEIDPEAKVVYFGNGVKINYGKLLIATGSRANKPNIPGITDELMTFMWTMAQAEVLKDLGARAHKVVVLGGGLIGIQALKALWDSNREIELIELTDRLLPAMLDSTGSILVERELTRHGITVKKGQRVNKINKVCAGEIEVQLDSGIRTKTNLLVLATGVLPNTEFLEGSGIKINHGIIVNQLMETSVANIYAAGDVAEGPLLGGGKGILATWPNALEQGRVAGLAMAGRKRPHQGGFSINVIKVFGLNVFSAMVTNKESDELISFEDNSKNSYRKLLFHKNKLRGVILVGDMLDGGIISAILQRQESVSQLLSSLKHFPETWGDTILKSGRFYIT